MENRGIIGTALVAIGILGSAMVILVYAARARAAYLTILRGVSNLEIFRVNFRFCDCVFLTRLGFG